MQVETSYLKKVKVRPFITNPREMKEIDNLFIVMVVCLILRFLCGITLIILPFYN